MTQIFGPDAPPFGAVTAERDYWKVGDGIPGSGQIGYDLRWLDANDQIVGERIVRVDNSVPITQAEYDALLLAWENFQP